MIQGMLRRFVPLMLAALILVSLPLTAAAAEDSFDLDKTCRITVTLRDIYTTKPIAGSEAVLYQVGAAYVENGALCYSLTEDFSASGLSLSDLKAEGLAQKFADYAAGQKLAGVTKEADQEGTIVFEGLSAGAYLVMQKEAQEGYLRVAPFLVSLPMYGEKGWQYEVAAGPKVARPPLEPEELTVVKHWLVNKSEDIPASITVSLYRDGEVFDEAVLSDDNDWSHTWTDLNAYFQWTVKESEIPKGFTAEYKTTEGRVKITNTADNYKPRDEDKLIQTGQLNWPVPVLVSGGLVLVLVGVVCITRGKRRDA